VVERLGDYLHYTERFKLHNEYLDRTPEDHYPNTRHSMSPFIEFVAGDTLLISEDAAAAAGSV
jgi:hypothetical protein